MEYEELFPSQLTHTDQSDCAIRDRYRIIIFILLYSVDIPLKSKYLNVLEWTDEQGRSQSFRLKDEVSSKWRDFGIQLDMEQNTMVNWDREYLGDNNACWECVMQAWLERGHSDYPVTWEGLYDLLEHVGCTTAAADLKRAVRKASQH